MPYISADEIIFQQVQKRIDLENEIERTEIFPDIQIMRAIELINGDEGARSVTQLLKFLLENINHRFTQPLLVLSDATFWEAAKLARELMKSETSDVLIYRGEEFDTTDDGEQTKLTVFILKGDRSELKTTTN